MNRLIYFVLFVLVSLLFLRCKDDDMLPLPPPPPSPPPPCAVGLDSVAIPAINKDTVNDFSWCVTFYNPIYPERYKYTYPSFNPNNADEIAFVRWDIQEDIWHLCTFNFCSGEFVKLTDKGFIFVDWGKQDWIVFIGKDLQVWKIKSNGEGLIRLTNGGENANCIWNADATKIAYTQTSSNYFILDENALILDTVEEMKARLSYDWVADEKLLTTGAGTGLISARPGFFDLNTKEFTFVDMIEGYLIEDMKWEEGENNIIWNTRHKIAKININTGTRTKIIAIPEGVNNRRYYNITISPDFKYIVTSREDWKQLNACDVEIRTNLYIMNIDGTDERKILIPE